MIRRYSKSAVLLLFLMLQTYVFSQDRQPQQIDEILLITLSPLALADIYDGASYRIGSEIKAGSKLAFALEAGGYLNYLKSTKINPKGFIVKPEIKYYHGNNAKGDRKFVSFEYGFKDQEYGFRHKLLVEERPVEKKYQMFRKTHTFTFKYGVSRKLGHRFYLQWFGGIGLRLLHSGRELSESERDYIDAAVDDCSMQENLIKVEGRKVYPNFQLGLRLGLGL